MATKPVNLRLDEAQIMDIKEVAGIFSMSFTDVIREAVKDYLVKMKKDPFYRLTSNISEVTDEENKELVSELSSLTEDDMKVAETEVIHIG